MGEEVRRSSIGGRVVPAPSPVVVPAAPAEAPVVNAAPSSPKIVLKSVDMNETMREDAYHVAREAFEKYTMEKEIAEYIKKEFDRKYGQTWHCIVGRNFDIYSAIDFLKLGRRVSHQKLGCGSYVTHERNHFLYFYVDSKAVLLFKSG